MATEGKAALRLDVTPCDACEIHSEVRRTITLSACLATGRYHRVPDRQTGAAMNTKHSKKERLEAAASHHERAGRFHREASRHFEEGKDFAHAAHQAMMAHGHALHAIDRANDAHKHNANTPLILPPSPDSAESGATAAQHHATAAKLHEQAALHLRNAARHFDQDRGVVAHETQLALALALHALSHSNAAAMQHVSTSHDRDTVVNATWGLRRVCTVLDFHGNQRSGVHWRNAKTDSKQGGSYIVYSTRATTCSFPSCREFASVGC